MTGRAGSENNRITHLPHRTKCADSLRESAHLLLCFKRRLFLPPVYILSELSFALFGNESLAGKVNLAVGFDFDYANKNLIADADNILNALNTLV